MGTRKRDRKLLARLPDRGLLVLLALAAGIRISFAMHTSVGVTGDAILYIQGANEFVEGGLSAVSVYKGPFYSILLGAFAKLLGVAPGTEWLWSLTNGTFDLLSLVLLYRAGKRLLGEIALPGIAFVALCPLWWGQFNTASSEDLAVLLLIAVFERWCRTNRSRRDEAWAGVFAGLLVLTRPVYLFFPFALLAFERFLQWTGSKFAFGRAPPIARADFRSSLRLSVGCYAVICVWGLIGLSQGRGFGIGGTSFQPILMTWLAIQIPDFDFRLDSHRKFWHDHPFLDTATAQDVARMKTEIFQYISKHPFHFLGMFPAKVYHLWVGHGWNPFSYIWVPRFFGPIFTWCFTVPVLLFGVIGVVTVHRKGQKPGGKPLSIASWRASCFALCSTCYITVVTLPLIVEARFGLQAYVLLGLWMGGGFLTLVSHERRPGVLET